MASCRWANLSSSAGADQCYKVHSDLYASFLTASGRAWQPCKPAASVKAVSDTQLQHAQRPAAQHSDLAGLSAQAVSQPEQVQAGRAGASADSSGQLSHSKQVQLQSWLLCLAVRTCFPLTDINLVQTANVCHKCIHLQRLTLHRTVSVQRIWPNFVAPTQTLTVDCVSSF